MIHFDFEIMIILIDIGTWRITLEAKFGNEVETRSADFVFEAINSDSTVVGRGESTRRKAGKTDFIFIRRKNVGKF